MPAGRGRVQKGRRAAPAHPLAASDAPEVNSSGEGAEQPRRKIYPELVKGHGIALADPNDRDVFHRNEYPANENHPLRAGIAGVAFVHDHLPDKRVMMGLGGGSAGKEVEKAGEHAAAVRP